MVKAKKYVVKSYFSGYPKRTDFEIVESELPPLKDGEVLIKAEYISVDPYQRAYNRLSAVPYNQFGYQVGEVIESKNNEYPVGSKVVTHKGWCDYSIASSENSGGLMETLYKLPDLQGLPLTVGLSAVGMVGATAYHGFLDICQPKSGETVVVTGAAGAVGSLVGQIAKIKGCKVIGFAGSDAKVQWLEKELGFDKAFNYKTVDAAKALKEAAPSGIDCYFDNVGGELSSIIISQMNVFGRVSVCGSISAYNEDPNKMPKAPILQPSIVSKQLKIEGFIVTRWSVPWNQAFTDIIKWIKEGKLIVRDHLTEGFGNTFDAFVGMLAGENSGKAIVKV